MQRFARSLDDHRAAAFDALAGLNARWLAGLRRALLPRGVVAVGMRFALMLDTLASALRVGAAASLPLAPGLGARFPPSMPPVAGLNGWWLSLWIARGDARALRLPLAAAAALACAGAAAQTTTIEIQGHYDNAIGSSDAASQGVITAALLKSRPALRPGEVLEFVPGLIVTQHAGDGKANQYFLRGFNLDHGTDFATSVNGTPVNMPSHAHGQGYSDLNFLIPELVQRIEYRKGPYFAGSGDFASAGAADIVYRQRFDAPFAQLTLGSHQYRRGVFGGSTGSDDGLRLLAAAELMHNDGPWTVPERLRRGNAVVTASAGTVAAGWSLSLMGYGGRWTSTDQIPERALQDGSLGRFDSLDPTSGGKTTRSSLSGSWHRRSDTGSTQASAYLLRYTLDLFSNFTYALERPVDGDQFEQQDRRNVLGGQLSHTLDHQIGSLPARSEVGVQLRQDRASLGLYDSVQRRRSATLREDRVRETLLGVYAQTGIEFLPRLRGVFGLRADRLTARVDARTQPDNGGSASDSQLSPKLSLVAGPWAKTEFFVNAGSGFHSNDARGSTARVDPRSGDPVQPVPPLVASRGAELGARTELLPGLQSSLALWRLDFGSELVYVGDAGSTEASAGSRRRGVEWNNRWAPVAWLLLDADLAWTHARFANGDRIPNAVDKVASLAASLRALGPWSASLQWRYLGSGALTEDNSVRSRASLTSNLRISRSLGAGAEATLDVFNLLNRQVDDIQYFYTSQLPSEAATGPVDDRHVHPAEPRSLRLSLRLAF